MHRGLAVSAVAVVALATIMFGAPAGAETKTLSQEVGDEDIVGHDITRVRVTNRTGAVVITMWAGQLHASDVVEIYVLTRDQPDYAYLGVAKRVKGTPVATVRPFFPLGSDPICTAHVRWNTGRDLVRVRAQDACFPGSDLSKVGIDVNLGVRGHNFVSDMASRVVVRRD